MREYLLGGESKQNHLLLSFDPFIQRKRTSYTICKYLITNSIKYFPSVVKNLAASHPNKKK